MEFEQHPPNKQIIREGKGRLKGWLAGSTIRVLRLRSKRIQDLRDKFLGGLIFDWKLINHKVGWRGGDWKIGEPVVGKVELRGGTMQSERSRVMGWLVGEWQWPAASLFAACLLLLLLPVWLRAAGLALALVYLQLPVYMLHQWEEHAGDRFRQYVNKTMAGGRKALTPSATFWINALGVWAVDLAALTLACFVNPALGLIAAYLPLVNAVGHIAPAVKRRSYNPGLWTSLVLFLPLGGWCVYEIAAISHAGWEWHALGIGVAVAVHAAIIIHVVRRLARLRGESVDRVQNCGVAGCSPATPQATLSFIQVNDFSAVAGDRGSQS